MINSAFEKNFDKYPLHSTSLPREKINEIYNRDYLFNLANIITDKRIDACWYDIKELTPYNRKANKDFASRKKDDYLKSTSDKTILAKDIFENGTYWALVVGEDLGGNIVAYKGAHRVISVKLLDESGIWDGRKFLCIKLEGRFRTDFREFYYEYIPLEQPIKQRVPMEMMYQGNMDINEIRKHMAQNNIKIIDDAIIEMELYDYKSLIRAFNFLPIWLRNPMFAYKIKPNKIINDIELFNEWLRGDDNV